MLWITVAMVLGAALVAARPIAGTAFAGLRSLGAENEIPSDFSPYIYRAGGARADPVNLIFRAGSADEVAAAVTRVLGWNDLAGSPMTFAHQDGQRATARQLGLDLSEGNRLHLRIETTAGQDQGFVLAAVHRDVPMACGHAGRDFDGSRDTVAKAFEAAGYRIRVISLGNTESGRHCDGSWTRGDGSAVIVDLRQE